MRRGRDDEPPRRTVRDSRERTTGGHRFRDSDAVAAVSHVLERRGPHRLLVALAVVGSLHLFFVIAVELNRDLVHRREITRLTAEVKALTAELEALDQVAARGFDTAYREALARNQGFVYPNESLLVTQRE